VRIVAAVFEVLACNLVAGTGWVVQREFRKDKLAVEDMFELALVGDKAKVIHRMAHKG
jgi:hypothetical protein